MTLIEVLVGIVLSAVLLAAVGPLWVGSVRSVVGTQEHLLQLQRWGVIAARFERDVRLASAVGRPELACVPLLGATPNRVVLVTRTVDGQGLELVAWEIVGGTLMRRRSSLPPEGEPPTVVSFTDNKTMFEGAAWGTLSYRCGSTFMGASVESEAMSRVDSVGLRLFLKSGAMGEGDSVLAWETLGR